MDEFLNEVSKKANELGSLVKEGDNSKALIVIAIEDHKDGRVGMVQCLAGVSTLVVTSLVEFMKKNQGNVIWQAVRATENNK